MSVLRRYGCKCFRFFFLVCALAVYSVIPVSAADESDWVYPTISVENASYGGIDLTIYGTETHYKLDADNNGLFDYSKDVTEAQRVPGVSGAPLNNSGGAGVFTVDTPVPFDDWAPYNHYESDQKTYYTLWEYPQIAFSTSIVRFVTDLTFEPGFYELDTTFNISETLIKPDGNQYLRPSTFEVGVENQSRVPSVIWSGSDHTKMVFEVTESSRLYFAASLPSGSYPYTVSTSAQKYPSFRFRLQSVFVRYRSVDSADVAALDSANTSAGNSMSDYDSVESQWVGSMTENFNALNMQDFTFPSGLLSGFSLITGIFNQIWGVLGQYQILYVFPLFLGIALLLIGRLSKFAGSQSSSTKDRGDDSA